MSGEVVIFTAEALAPLLQCSVKTVEAAARSGALPGVKFGDGWIFPAGALAQRLDELALQQAADRRTLPPPAATTTGPQLPSKPRRGPKARPLPRLVDMGPARS